jgi:hypothetical protein
MSGSAPSLLRCSSQLGSLRWDFILEKAALAHHMAQRLAHRLALMGLLFLADPFFRSGVHPGLCESIRLARGSCQQCGCCVEAGIGMRPPRLHPFFGEERKAGVSYNFYDVDKLVAELAADRSKFKELCLRRAECIVNCRRRKEAFSASLTGCLADGMLS